MNSKNSNFNNFVDRANIKHKNKFEYSKFNYVNSSTPSTIICPYHGNFSQTPSKHINSTFGCPDCYKEGIGELVNGTIEKRFNEFLDKAENKYGGKYDYSKFTYVSAKKGSIIICPVHGEFKQSPDKHLNSKYGCKKCSHEKIAENTKGVPKNIPPKYTIEEIYKKFVDKYKGYDIKIDPKMKYLSQKGKYTHIVICKEHGETKKNNLFSLLLDVVKTPCYLCSKSRTSTSLSTNFHESVEMAREIHGDLYLYHEEGYYNQRSKIKMDCILHGEFEKSMDKHIHSKQGCPECKKIDLLKSGNLYGVINEGLFISRPDLKDIDFYVYYARFEKIYKIGISKNPDVRVNVLRRVLIDRDDYELLDTYKTTMYKAFKIESYILDKYKEYNANHEESTEFFNIDVLETTKISTFKNIF